MKERYMTSLPNPLCLGRCALLTLLLLLANCGCRSKAQQKNNDFFTSGSREADQRAGQRMAKAEQLDGSGEGSGEKGVKKAVRPESEGGTNKAAQAEGKMSLFDRLGGERGITAIVEDFTPRLLEDPRVNWRRVGVKQSGWFKGN